MKIALITGASRGIGRAVACELDARGWGILALSRDPTRLHVGTRGLSNVLAQIANDLGAGQSAVESVRKQVAASVEAIDLLVLNAGIFIEGPLSEVDADEFRRNMAVNLEANVFLVKELLPMLRRGSSPRIVIIGSTAAYEAYPLVPTYGVAKWALRGFALNLRRELMTERIGVTFLSPGGTLTDMWAGEDLPPGRLLDPKDIALLVACLAELSEQAVVEELVVRPMLGDIHE